MLCFCMNFLNVMVHSILFYGFETWPIRLADKRMVEVFGNDSIHRILHAGFRDCVSSVELQRTFDIECKDALHIGV